MIKEKLLHEIGKYFFVDLRANLEKVYSELLISFRCENRDNYIEKYIMTVVTDLDTIPHISKDAVLSLLVKDSVDSIMKSIFTDITLIDRLKNSFWKRLIFLFNPKIS